jgi:hypothetical protein
MSLSQSGLALCALHRSDLELLFREGQVVDPETIVGYRYRGVSLGLPEWIERLTWKKFAKTFYRHASGAVRGENLRIEQDELAKPWRVQTKKGQQLRFGPYELAREGSSDHVEIDYSRGSQGLSPLRRLRDPLRRLDEQGDLLLGASLVDLGFGRRLATPSWFLLERDQEL